MASDSRGDDTGVFPLVSVSRVGAFSRRLFDVMATLLPAVGPGGPGVPLMERMVSYGLCLRARRGRRWWRRRREKGRRREVFRRLVRIGKEVFLVTVVFVPIDAGHDGVETVGNEVDTSGGLG